MSDAANLSKIKADFSESSHDNKVSVLSTLALEITIGARGAYSGHEDGKTGLIKLVGFNEIQHTIASQLAKMLTKDEARYPDDVFLDILFEKAESNSSMTELFTALKVAFDRAGSA